jgi:hypothetical protein
MKMKYTKLFSSKGLEIILYLILIYFAYLMWLITLQYIPVNFQVAFLSLKGEEMRTWYYPYVFFTHVYTSLIALAAGAMQFSTYIREQHMNWHKAIGKIYIFLILFLCAPTGLVMGYHGNGGFYSKISFCIQAILWFTFTYMAFTFIRSKNIMQHINYIILSYSLTLSAISLRLFKWIIVNTLALPPMDTYKIVVWLGWLFNLMLAIIIINYRLSRADKQMN